MNAKKKEVLPEIETLQQELTAAQEAHKRALADYKNLEFRVSQERAQIRKIASAEVLQDLLPTLDHLEMALQHFADPSLQMIANQLKATLEQHGLKRIVTVGQPFSAETMEAVDVIAGPKDQVVREQRAGYTLFETVVRHAHVVVGNGEAENTKESEQTSK